MHDVVEAEEQDSAQGGTAHREVFGISVGTPVPLDAALSRGGRRLSCSSKSSMSSSGMPQVARNNSHNRGSRAACTAEVPVELMCTRYPASRADKPVSRS
ncbi:hypothetical protein AB0L41_48425 [Amycolatopsis mediterranei]|uniref:hypothetical protein n=1 Tax=Amycolatopsis mediterranei TaxID=33910 RepID=UPI00342FE484